MSGIGSFALEWCSRLASRAATRDTARRARRRSCRRPQPLRLLVCRQSPVRRRRRQRCRRRRNGEASPARRARVLARRWSLIAFSVASAAAGEAPTAMSTSPARIGANSFGSSEGSCWPSRRPGRRVEPVVARVLVAGLHSAADSRLNGSHITRAPAAATASKVPVGGAVVHHDDLEVWVERAKLRDHADRSHPLVERRNDGNACLGEPRRRVHGWLDVNARLAHWVGQRLK